jgi:hypothetical protein
MTWCKITSLALNASGSPSASLALEKVENDVTKSSVKTNDNKLNDLENDRIWAFYKVFGIRPQMY